MPRFTRRHPLHLPDRAARGLSADVVAAVNATFSCGYDHERGLAVALGHGDESDLTAADRTALGEVTAAGSSIEMGSFDGWPYARAWLDYYDTGHLAAFLIWFARTHPTSTRTPAVLYEATWPVVVRLFDAGMFMGLRTATRDRAALVLDAACHELHHQLHHQIDPTVRRAPRLVGQITR